MTPILHTLLNPWRCCMCEYQMHRGEKAILITKGRSTAPKYVMHVECAVAMKDMIDQDDEETTDGAA